MKMPYRLRSPRTVIGLVTLLGLSACAVHSDSGAWSGSATASDDAWKQSYPCTANADITHTETVVSLNSLDLYCGPDSLHWAPSAFTLRDGALYLGNLPVGTIDGNDAIHLDIPDPFDNAQYPRQPDHLEVTWAHELGGLHLTLTEWYGSVAHAYDVDVQQQF